MLLCISRISLREGTPSNGTTLVCSKRGMGYEGVDCTAQHLPLAGCHPLVTPCYFQNPHNPFLCESWSPLSMPSEASPQNHSLDLPPYQRGVRIGTRVLDHPLTAAATARLRNPQPRPERCSSKDHGAYACDTCPHTNRK